MPWAYRNHSQFSLTSDGQMGFQAPGSHRVVPIEECWLLHPLLQEMWAALEFSQSEAGEAGEQTQEENGGTGQESPASLGTLFRRISLRAGINTGEQMVVFETYDDEPFEIEVSLPVSCVFLLSDGTPVTLVGQPYLTEIVGGRPYRITASSFFQVNTVGAEALLQVVRTYLDPHGHERVLDAYCGVGLFGLALAEQVGQVVGIESQPSAVADAMFNAQNLDNVKILPGAVEEILPGLTDPFDVVIVDPPRAGLAPSVIETLVRQRVPKLIYVSCDPATLARDARRLVDHGYRLVEVQPVDLFPQTFHIESCVLFLAS